MAKLNDALKKLFTEKANGSYEIIDCECLGDEEFLRGRLSATVDIANFLLSRCSIPRGMYESIELGQDDETGLGSSWHDLAATIIFNEPKEPCKVKISHDYVRQTTYVVVSWLRDGDGYVSNTATVKGSPLCQAFEKSELVKIWKSAERILTDCEEDFDGYEVTSLHMTLLKSNVDEESVLEGSGKLTLLLALIQEAWKRAPSGSILLCDDPEQDLSDKFEFDGKSRFTSITWEDSDAIWVTKVMRSLKIDIVLERTNN